MEKEILELLKKMDSRLGEMDERLANMDARFDKMDSRLDKMDSRLDKMDARLDKMDSRIGNLEEGQNRIEKKLDGVVDQTADLTEFRTTVISKLDELKVVEEVTKANCYEIAKLKIVK